MISFCLAVAISDGLAAHAANKAFIHFALLQQATVVTRLGAADFMRLKVHVYIYTYIYIYIL